MIVAPVDERVDWIDRVRGRFDPLAAAVPPHFTLVYPFPAELDPASLRSHMVEALAGFEPFDVVLGGVSGSERRYLRYDVERGDDDLIALHDRLHTGPLAVHLDLGESFHPHLTVGRLEDEAAWGRALLEIAGTAPRTRVAVRRIVSYRRYPDGRRAIDNSVELVTRISP